MAAGLEAEKAVPVTEVQDHSRQRDLFNLAGIAHDEAHFDKMVVLVTRHGCDPNARNTAANYHYTPMHQAAVAGNIESLAVLIGLGGNVNVFDGAEYSPMHRACSHAKYQSVALLIAFGADVVLPGRHGNTPLHVAAFMESSRCLGVILASGKAELERRNGPEHNATALMRAVEGGTLRCVKALVKAGADLFATRVWPSRAEVARVKAAGGKLPTPIEETASDLANRLGDGPIAGYLAQQMRTRTDGKAAFEAFQDMREERAAAAASEADAAAKAQAAADLLAEAARGGEAVASGDDAANEPRQAGPDSMPLGAGLHYSGPRALRSGRTASAAVRGEGGEASDVSEIYELSEAAKEQRRRQQSLRPGEALFGGNVASDATMREREGLAPRAVDRGASLAEVLTEEAVAAFLAKHASGVAALQAALDSRAAETGPVADAPSKPGSAAGAALSAPGASVSGAGAMTAGTAASAGTPVAEAGSRAATAFVPSPLAYRPVTGSFKMVRFHPTEDKDDGAQRRMQELDDEAARLGLARTWSSAASPEEEEASSPEPTVPSPAAGAGHPDRAAHPTGLSRMLSPAASAGSATTGPSLSPVRTAFVRALSEAKPLDTDGAIPRVDVSQLLFRESDVMGEGKDKEVFKGWVQPEDGGELLPVAIAKLKSANASKTKEHGFMEALAGCPGVSQLVAWAVDKHYNYYAFVFAQYGDLAQQANRVGQAVRADWSRRVAPALVRSTAAKAMELLRTSAAATGPPRAEAPGARSSLDCYASAGIEPRHDPTLAGADASDIDRAAMQAVLSLGAEAIEPVVASLRSCAREVQRACEAWTEPVWLDSGVMSAPSVFGRVMPATAALVVSPTVLLQGCLQAARGLLAISDLGAIHGDFAARNVLVLEMQEHAPFADASRFRVAVSDFGMSLWVTTEESVVPREAPDGMPMRWQSPEVFRSKKFSAKGDVWSWAVMCWELLTLGAGPFLDRDFPHTECFSNEGKPLGINAAAAYGVEGTAPLFLDDAVREAQNAQAKGRGRRWAPSAVTYGQPRLRLGRPGIGVTSSAAAAARIERMRLDGADDAAIAAAAAAATASHPWIPNDMWSLMQQCWAEAPAMRPSFRAVVAEMEGIVAGLHKGR
ncbi:hypothetical protein FNF27_02217 [Cafeteria roenbergensis]|uniref:Protein kinase domain-containing protein n=1 Tax=Cafeteria roenbergensis TaxID=33653 RepID=A0A5A8EJR7_CAFRO|nr:hypothetical protein FNF27_02217 [Cafeteria roenbergensis]